MSTSVHDPVSEAKKQARTEAFARRKIAHNQASGTRPWCILEGLLEEYAGATLAGYMPIHSEIDPRPAMTEYPGTCCVPVIVAAATPLRFAKWTAQSPMIEGAFRALIPKDPDYIIPDLLIVPLVAFTRDGYRLGYGGGFYDRTLTKLRAEKQIAAIGFAYGAQETATLPLDAYDAPLDIIVTDTEILRF